MGYKKESRQGLFDAGRNGGLFAPPMCFGSASGARFFRFLLPMHKAGRLDIALVTDHGTNAVIAARTAQFGVLVLIRIVAAHLFIFINVILTFLFFEQYPITYHS
jgi:hypothetical protein